MDTVFIHGDLAIVPWFSSTVMRCDGAPGMVQGGQGEAYDLATLTLAHEEHLDDVVAGYGGDIDLDVIRAVPAVAT